MQEKNSWENNQIKISLLSSTKPRHFPPILAARGGERWEEERQVGGQQHSTPVSEGAGQLLGEMGQEWGSDLKIERGVVQYRFLSIRVQTVVHI